MATLEEISAAYTGEEEEEDPLLTMALSRRTRRQLPPVKPRIDTGELLQVLNENITSVKERSRTADYERQLIESSGAAQPSPVPTIAPTIPVTRRPGNVPLSMAESYSPGDIPASQPPEQMTTGLTVSNNLLMETIGLGEGVLAASTELGAGVFGMANWLSSVTNQAFEEFNRNLFSPRADPNFFRNAKKAMDEAAAKVPIYTPRSRSGQLTRDVLMAIPTAFNMFSKGAADEARRAGVDEDSAEAIEGALNFVGFAELGMLGRAAQVRYAKFRAAVKKNGLLNPETINLAKNIADDVDTVRKNWNATPEFPTYDSYQQHLISKMQESMSGEQVIPTPEAPLPERNIMTVPPDTTDIPTVTSETPVVEGVDLGVFTEPAATPTSDRPRGVRTGRKRREEAAVTPVPVEGVDLGVSTEPYPIPTMRPAKVELTNIPDYIRDNVDRNVDDIERMGLIDDVIRLSSENLTAREVFRELSERFPDDMIRSVAENLIRSVRLRYGIKSVDDLREMQALESKGTTTTYSSYGVRDPNSIPVRGQAVVDRTNVAGLTESQARQRIEGAFQRELNLNADESRQLYDQLKPPAETRVEAERVSREAELSDWRERLNRPDTRKEALANLKAEFREGKKGRVNYTPGLEAKGFTPEEIAAIIPEMRATKATRPKQPVEEAPSRVITTSDIGIATQDPNYAAVLRELVKDPEASVAQIAGELGLSMKVVEPLRNSALASTEGTITPTPRETPIKKPGRPKKPKEPAVEPAVSTGPLKYHASNSVKDLETALGNNRFRGEASTPNAVDAPIAIGYDGRTPEGVYLDTTGLDVTESAADINAQMAAGTLTNSQGMHKLGLLSKKARVAGVPIGKLT